MVGTFQQQMADEIGRLEDKLRDNKDFQRLMTLRNAMALYTDGADMDADERSAGASQVAPRERKANRERSGVLDAVVAFLHDQDAPIPTRDILAHLDGVGITVGGAVPVSNLSALLSKSDIFTPHGRSGWTMVRGQNGSSDDVDEETSSEEESSHNGNHAEQASNDVEHSDTSLRREPAARRLGGWE